METNEKKRETEGMDEKARVCSERGSECYKGEVLKIKRETRREKKRWRLLYMSDCQLGEKKDQAGRKRVRERWRKVKGSMNKKTIIPGRLTSQGFLCCQSGLYSVIDCEGLENSKSLWDWLLRCCGDSSRKNLWRVWKCFQWELHMSTPGKCWVQKIVFPLLAGEELA